jgi:hypothetical protein
VVIQKKTKKTKKISIIIFGTLSRFFSKIWQKFET